MLAALLTLAAVVQVPAAEPLVLLVQPAPWAGERPRFEPGPLGALIERAADLPVKVRLSDDTLSHWLAVRSPHGYQMAFDEAHFTAYRARRHGFRVLAREVGEVRFAVVARPGALLAAPSDLSVRRVAAPEPPSLATVRLLELFRGAVQAPRLLTVVSTDAAFAALDSGEVDAALLPLDDGGSTRGRVAALVTDASPGRGFSVAPGVDETTRTAIARALLGARATPAGRRALAAFGVRAFEAAADAVYEDSEHLLKGVWGY